MQLSTEGSSIVTMRPDAGALHPSVLEAMAVPAAPAGSLEFAALIDAVRRKAGDLIGARQRPLLASGSGTRMTEVALTQLLTRQGEIVVVRNGYFGSRLEKIARLHRGDQVVVAEAELGQPVEPNDLARTLGGCEDVAAVLLVQVETSTGVLNPLDKLARVVRQKCPGALVFVDAIGAFGAHEIRFDEWEIDALAVTFHKVIAGPSGLAALALSCRAWRAIEAGDVRSFSDDLRRLHERQQDGGWLYAPPVHVLQGVDRALDLVFAEGVEEFRQRLQAAARVLREAMSASGFELIADDQHAATSSTVARVPDGREARLLVDRLREKQIEILSGRGEVAATTVRLSHFGQQSVEAAKRVAQRIGEAARELSAGETIDGLKVELLEIERVVPHERFHRGHGSGLRDRILADGNLTNPVIVQQGERGRYPLNDGTHRWWLLQELGRKWIPAQVVEDSELEVRSWCHAVRIRDDGILLDELTAAGLELQELPYEDAEAALETRALLAWFALAGERNCVGILWPRAGVTEALCQLVDAYDGATPRRLVAEEFEQGGQVDPRAVFELHRHANLFVRFACFTAADIRAFAEEPIPAGITRIVVKPGRLLGVNAPLDVLEPQATLEDRQAWLASLRSRPARRHRGPVTVGETQGERLYEEDVVALDPDLGITEQ